MNNTLTGAELIAQERKEQIEKHSRSLQYDADFNTEYQLAHGASLLLQKSFPNIDTGLDDTFRMIIPEGWSKEIMQKMFDKPYKERLIIAGALIAAEIDRLNHTTNE